MQPETAATNRTADGRMSMFSAIKLALLVLAVLCYLAAKYVYFDKLPSKWFGDSSKLIDISQNMVAGAGSYAATASLFSLLPIWLLDLYVVVLVVGFLVLCHRAANNFLTLAGLWLVLIPMIPQDLMVPNKETVVVTLTLVILLAFRHLRPTAFLTVVIVGYLAYGAFVRTYFILILFVWIGILLFRRASPVVKIYILVLALVSAMYMPANVYEDLQTPRDISNKWASTVAGSDNRTAFFNPYPPDGSLQNFALNYVYSAFVLTFPVFFFGSFKEILLMSCVFFCAYVVIVGLRSKAAKVRSLAALFLSHCLVLWIFEPDLGSYFRHFSSVMLYLMPSLALIGMPAREQVEARRELRAGPPGEQSRHR